jgi:metal-responsive CopG/Arc/MetJ family transcriptional regulator
MARTPTLRNYVVTNLEERQDRTLFVKDIVQAYLNEHPDLEEAAKKSAVASIYAACKTLQNRGEATITSRENDGKARKSITLMAANGDPVTAG